MIYLQKSKKKSKRALYICIGVLAFLAVAWVLMAKSPQTLNAFARTIGTPFWQTKIFFTDKTGALRGFFRSKSALIAENDNLKTELDSLRAKLMNFDVLSSEHTKLLEDFARTTSEGKILAAVLVRPPQSPYDTLILDVGNGDGISAGDVVYSTGGVALGSVKDVSGASAKAELFSRSGVETSAIVERTSLALALRGAGGGSFEVEVPQETDILKDDTIIMPTLETTIIGFVVDVESNVKSAFKRVLIQIPVNISHLRFVLVEPRR